MSKLMTVIKHPRRSAYKVIALATDAISKSKLDGRLVKHLEAHIDSKAFRPEYTELLRLYEYVRARKPAIVWEFGSGWSTSFLAQGLHDNGSGLLYSMEDNKQWHEHTKSIIPDWLARFVELRHAPAQKTQINGECAWQHPLPEQIPDMIYLDGPDLQDCYGCADIPMIEDRLKPGTLIVVDGRSKTTRILRTSLKRQWSYEEHRGPLDVVFCQRVLTLD